MRDSGVITEIKGKTAVVSVDKKAECAGCGLCLFKEGTNKAEFYAKNTAGAKVGDTVIIERSDSGKFLGVVLAFFVPLILIGLAVLINYLFIKNEIFILVLSVAFIAVWYAILAFLDKKLKNIGACNSRIVSVITPDNTDNSDTKE